MAVRPVKTVYTAVPTLEGAGVHLKRVFGFSQVPDLDPFLLLDDFHSGNPPDYLPGFPWHPHRGIETVTYVLHGKVEHGDSMGNRGVIGEGEVQWMTAGSGIIHQEMPGGDRNGLLWGFQLWVNLPRSDKMMDPRYREVKADRIPLIRLTNGVTVKVIAGEIEGIKGPVQDIVTNPGFFDITVPPGSVLSIPVRDGDTALAYLIEGQGRFDSERDSFLYGAGSSRYLGLPDQMVLRPGHLVLYGNGDAIRIEAAAEGMHILLFTGKPVHEPVAWYGPIVMNTEDELKVAFEEYRNGTFIRYRQK